MADGKGSPEALGVRCEWFCALAENLEDCVYAQDAGGRCVFANRALLDWLGRTEAEVLGVTDEGLWPPDLAAALAADRARVLVGELLEGEERLPRGNGLQTVRVRKHPLR